MKKPLTLTQKAVLWLARKALPGISRTYSLQDTAFGKLLSSSLTYTGKSVDTSTALQISTVFACVRILAETVGNLPWAIYEKDTKTGNMTKVDHDLGDVLCSSPNIDMTDVEFREAVVSNLGTSGNGYSFTDRRNNGSVISVYPICSDYVIPQRRDDGTVYYKVWERGKWEEYPREKIWHVKGFGSSGLLGYSPIGMARQAAGMALAAEEFQARFFQQGAQPSWIVSIPEWLEDNQREPARKNLMELWSGQDNFHGVRFLEGGMTATQATMPLNDAQFLELRRFTVEEICRFYRIPPHMVADLERSTNNNIEQQSLEFVMYTLAPWLTRIESSATKWLFLPKDRSRFFLRFNVEGLLRADAAARAELHSKYVQNGIMNRNEVCAIEKLPKVDDPAMNEYTVQTNMSPLDKLTELVAAQITKQSQPAPQLGNPPQKEQLN